MLYRLDLDQWSGRDMTYLSMTCVMALPLDTEHLESAAKRAARLRGRADSHESGVEAPPAFSTIDGKNK